MIEHLIREVSAGLAVSGEDLKSTVRGLDDDSFGAPTALPGWSRAHVVAHAEGISRAMQRQVEHAVQGETIDLYDGGYEGRVQAIEARAERPAADQKDALAAAVDDAVGAFENARDHWEAKISYRDGTVYDGALALWRELVIHASDLDAGTTSRDWSERFCHYLIDFLAARVPEGTALKLQPMGEEPITIQANGSGSAPEATHTLVVSGALQDIAAWLAGREPVGGLEATDAAEAVSLPELGTWPAAVSPR
ncbi:maleylpyruvate isomerase family mycothiol-dependent enzyme [Arthrobacter sp. H20]|uniref:maleylpyruvate isomerase family mycothiol-dependent enzyme n=1 Tax=Arthrobacter sp. H20 TaxID=1267981 RepID=UPI00047B2323|nr:maleylpyruvate isomerase family mycothiol-dependent enzyme [Arthrobacter sp. H20]